MDKIEKHTNLNSVFFYWSFDSILNLENAFDVTAYHLLLEVVFNKKLNN